jgi:hypothetical protein
VLETKVRHSIFKGGGVQAVQIMQELPELFMKQYQRVLLLATTI